MPYLHEHSCRLRDPKEFVSFTRKNEEQEHEGLPIDVIYGVLKNDKTHIQALRYPTEAWSEADAAEHCRSRDGEFHPALRRVEPDWPLALQIHRELIRYPTNPP